MQLFSYHLVKTNRYRPINRDKSRLLGNFSKFNMSIPSVLFVFTCILSVSIQLADSTTLNVTFDTPKVIEMWINNERVVNFSLFQTSNDDRVVEIRIKSSVPEVVQITPQQLLCTEGWETVYNGSFVIRAKSVARTEVTVVGITKNSALLESESLIVRVARNTQWITYWFDISVAVMVSLSYVHMGLTISTKTIGNILKRPVAPVVGFLCQFLIMPVTAYLAGQWLFDNDVLRIGLFIYGCCPGGGTIWTIILKGLIPMWMLTLGKKLFKNTWKIPIKNLVVSLVSMIVPVAIGLVVQYLFPKLQRTAIRLLLPLTLIMTIYLCLLGLFAYLDIFKMITWQIASASLLNVCLGFLIAIIVSKLMAFSTEDTIAVAVDTGVQHAGIALVLISFSFPSFADANLAKVVPITAYALTPCPLFLAFITQRIYGAFFKTTDDKMADSPDEKTQIDPNYSQNANYSTFRA
ncbi:ileal sodium/bile acid cotransporter-like isoform X2 [Centruroides sculpturatus]|uniref:ileal sodium/bile acid cotransporter-like isoform X2 n=1 Tax=Centruroides sculpturatus TaxID=218467 RepID=UPI000C6E27D7|nr:ileal sodium/bile acid cotransporter-like isoform X2 [Centruroides sculpturatus]